MLDVFPLDGATHFLFILLKNMIFRKRLGVATIFVLLFFLRGKKNKKENPKCDFLLGKDKSMKNRVWVRGSGYLLGRYGKDRNIPLSP